MLLYAKYIAGLFLCLTVYMAQAQQPSFATRHYTTDHGLPSPEVYDILEDQQGYLWFSTDNGVSRFNGYSFENFGPKQGLHNNVVFFLQEDHLGRIWMPTLSGNVYYYEKDTIKPYAYNHILQKYRNSYRQLGEFYVDKAGVFHVGLRGYGFIRIQPDGQHHLFSDELPCGAIIYEVEDHFLNVYISCNRNPTEVRLWKENAAQQQLQMIFKKDSSQKKIKVFNDQTGQYTGETVIKLQEGGYLCYRRAFLYLLDEDKNLIWEQPYPRPISFATQTPRGRIYISNDWERGIRVYDGVDAIRRGQYILLLDGNTVSHVIEDRFGGLWLSTVNNAVFYAPNQSYVVYNKTSGLSGEYVTAVAIKNKNETCIGLRNGAVYNLDKKQKRLIKLPSSEHPQEVFDLEYEPARKRLWKGAGILEYLENGKWNPPNPRFLQMNVANKKFNIYPESDLIVGASSGSVGFGLIRLSNGEFLFNTNLRPKLKARTLVACQDFSGRILIGRIDGLFELKDNSLLRPSLFPEDFNYRVENIAQLQDSTFVIASKGGGVVLWKDTFFFQINESDGLTSSMIENLHIDSLQTIWVGTLNGLNQVKWNGPEDFSIEQLTIADGLPSNEINDITSLGPDVWVATTRGLVQLPRETAIDSVGSPPILEQLLINNKPWSFDQSLVLPSHQNHFQLKYLTINYQLNGQIDYRYRLNPDEKWIVTQERNINLAALAPNNYEFEIQSLNEDGFWSDSARLAFTIRYPFWQTIWFWGMVAVCLLGAGFGFYKIRIRQLEKEARLEREKVAVERQVIELKQAALRAQMNPHFIFNCLNSIQGFIASGDKGKATRYLSRFAKLIRVTLDATLEAKIPLKADIEILENYLEMEQMRFKQKFEYQIIIDDNIDQFELEVPPMLVQPYVENSIIHGLVQPSKKGKLDIKYEQENGYLKVSVTDNGIGIFESKRQKLKQVLKQQPMGMSITRRRLELGNLENKNNKVRVEELKSKSGEVLGTRVTLLIGQV